MKTSKMMALLEKDQSLKFEAFSDDQRFVFYCRDGYLQFNVYSTSNHTKIISDDHMGGRFNGNFNMSELDWQILRDPVSWHEALRAGVDEGKQIKCECLPECEYNSAKSSCIFGRGFAKNGFHIICIHGAKHGTWYIEG